MAESYIITSVTGDKYLITEPVKYKGNIYYQAAKLDETNNFVGEYAALRQTVEGGKEFYEIVEDKQLCRDLMGIFAAMYMQKSTEGLPEEGTVMPIGDKEFILMQYIAYNNNAYMILLSVSKPVEVKVCRLISVDVVGDIELRDVSSHDEGILALRIYADLNS